MESVKRTENKMKEGETDVKEDKQDRRRTGEGGKSEEKRKEKISLAQRKEGWRIGEEKMDGTGEGERRRREKGGRESDEQRI